MSPQPISIEELRGFIHKGESTDPLLFLEAIMNGEDPRNLSEIYDLICEIDDWADGDINQSDWNEVVDCIRNHYKYQKVSVNESHSAAVSLASYLHPKQKQIEMKGGLGQGTMNVTDHPLTEEDIEMFKEKFNDEF